MGVYPPRRIRCVNPKCTSIKAFNGRTMKPALLCMASTGAGRVEIKCWRCNQMNLIDLGTVWGST